MDFLKKIQSQPKNVRVIILWAVLVIIGIILFVFWVLHSVRAVNSFSRSNFFEQLNVSDMKADVNKSVDDVKQKAEDIQSIKQKAEDILNDKEIERLIEEKLNEK
jgi:FtsZ-interacting cell division protein ZipA